ncbi:MAG: transposase [Isosphaeraceae bacterium]
MDHTSRSSRRRSCNEPGHAHELTFTCYQCHKFLVAERACRWLSESITAARRKLDFALWAYVFMPEHVHLIVCPRKPEYSMSALLMAIKEPVGRKAMAYLEQHRPDWLPRLARVRRGRRERLFWQSGGGFDRNITEPKTLQSMIDYIHQNPIRRRLVEHPSDWTWSSAGWYEGKATTELLPDRIPPEWATT